jgi:hypothetical protein
MSWDPSSLLSSTIEEKKFKRQLQLKKKNQGRWGAKIPTRCHLLQLRKKTLRDDAKLGGSLLSFMMEEKKTKNDNKLKS